MPKSASQAHSTPRGTAWRSQIVAENVARYVSIAMRRSAICLRIQAESAVISRPPKELTQPQGRDDAPAPP